MKAWHVIIFALICTVCLFTSGCLKRTDPAGNMTSKQVAAEVTKNVAAVSQPGFYVTGDDDEYSVIDHEWLEWAVARNVFRTWHDRAYVAEGKDCDDFTDKLVSDVRYWFSDAVRQDGFGGALAGKYDVKFPAGWHRVALFRTNRGWFVADPTKGINPKSRKLELVPLKDYGKPTRKAAF